MGATVTIAIEYYPDPQSMLCVVHQCGFAYGAADERPRSVQMAQILNITPQRVAELIRDALKQGWDPAAPSGKVVVTL